MREIRMIFVILYFQGKWEILSKAQGKKIKTQYEEEKRKQQRATQQEVINPPNNH